MTCLGRLFYTRAAATEKARSPMVVSRCGWRTVISDEDELQRNCSVAVQQLHLHSVRVGWHVGQANESTTKLNRGSKVCTVFKHHTRSEMQTEW